MLEELQRAYAEMLTSHSDSNFLTFQNNFFIYQNNINSTFINTLKSIYPLILKLVGNDFFHTLVQDYIKQYPSRSANLNEYGFYFKELLAQHTLLKNMPYLNEVALFEWTTHQLFYAADYESLITKKLRSVSPSEYEQLIFHLHPASALLHFEYPILRIIALCHGLVDSVNINEGGTQLLLLRRHLEINYLALDHADFTFLSHLQHALTLSAALNETLKIHNDFKLDEKMPNWIKENIIVDCSLSSC